MDFHEIIDIINDLNTKYYMMGNKNNSLIEALVEEYPPLTLKTTGSCHHVIFYGFTIWQSEEDERPYNFEEDETDPEIMPLKMWIEHEVMRILALMSDFHAMLLMES